jgi:hypothetical protein
MQLQIGHKITFLPLSIFFDYFDTVAPSFGAALITILSVLAHLLKHVASVCLQLIQRKKSNT